MGLNALALGTWHEREDVVGRIVGATLGNATELVCASAGVWVHTSRHLLGVAPFYIFLCYPILMLAMPRLLSQFAEEESMWKSIAAPVLLATHVLLSVGQARSNLGESVISAGCLAIALMLFHRPRFLGGPIHIFRGVAVPASAAVTVGSLFAAACLRSIFYHTRACLRLVLYISFFRPERPRT